MASTRRKVVLTDDWKENLRASNIMTRLMKHFEGEVELSRTQLDAAKIILAKILPDLKSIEHSGDQDKPMKMIIEWAEK